MKSQQKLFARYLQDMPSGRLDWIGLRPARKQPMLSVDTTVALETLGLEGDRRAQGSPGSGRQVTLISAEHIKAAAKILGRRSIPPELLRRNLVVSGINLNLLRHQEFKIGDAIFLGTSPCYPCSRMDDALGKGGAGAMYGHGGLCAKIIKSGRITLDDSVVWMPESQIQLPL